MTTSRRHGRHKLDPTIHSPVRFSIVAALATVDEAEFALIRDTVEVSDPVLSKQAYLLEDAGYVKVRKGHVGRKPRTWLSLTKPGRAAYEAHLEALQSITDSALGPAEPSRTNNLLPTKDRSARPAEKRQ